VLLASTILIETAAIHGLRAVGSDEYGMSQRGGSVISLIKVGDFASPLIGRENGDVLLAFEESEFYRALTFLKRGGVAIVNRKEKTFPPAIEAMRKERGYLFRTLDADGIAAAHGMVQAANMVLLGYFSSLAIEPYTFATMKGALESRVSAKFRQTNVELFEKGYREGDGEPAPDLPARGEGMDRPVKEKG
jgi:indolepyruvate ferredoxin oxidoreductase beta subunit